MTYYSEKLTPKASVLISAAVLCGMFGLLGLPFSQLVTLVAVITLAIVGPLVMWAMAPKVSITKSGAGPSGVELHCGRAHIDLAYLGEARALDEDGLHKLLGVESSGRDFVCYSPWIKTGVAIDNTDDSDPIATWVVCSRHPGRLIDSLKKHTPSR